MPNQQPTQLDPKIVDLAKAIRETESKGNFKASGKSGEYGAYQWMPQSWASASKKYLGADVPLTSATPEQQNQVAYKQLEEQAKLHPEWNVGNFASWWNSGSPDNYNNDHRGVNAYGVQYDTPGYSKKVAEAYQRMKQQRAAQLNGSPTGTTITGVPAQVPQQNPSFVQDVSKTISDTATGFVKGFDPVTQRGLMGLPSTVLQAGGALGAGVGGLLDNMLSHTPIVGQAYKGLTGLIGKGVEAAAGTKTGQEVLSGWKQFADAHPEMAADIEGAFNIATAIPILKGVGLAKTAAKDALVNATKKTVTKGAEAELRGALTIRPTKSLAKAESRNLAPLNELTKNPQYLPEVVRGEGGKFVYDVKKGAQALNDALDVDEGNLQAMLSQAVKKNVGVDLNTVRQRVLADVTKNYQLSGNYKNVKKAVNDYFDSVLESSPKGRTVIDLNELNGIKRDVRNAVFDMTGDVKGTASAEVKYLMGQSLMKQVEEIAKQVGVKGVPELNKTMATKLEALKVLKALDGKGIKTKGGLTRELATDVAGGVGEAVGGAFGLPFASTFAGRSLANFVGRRIPATQVSKLRRAGLNSPTNTLKKGLIRIGAGQGLQSTTRTENNQ